MPKKPGPRPTPDAILLARGSDKPQRRASKGMAAPVPTEALPVPVVEGVPTLDDARAVVCRAINDAGVGMKGGELAQEMLARAIVHYYESRERLNKWRASIEPTDLDAKSCYIEMTLSGISRASEDVLFKICVEHGLTPAAISGIHIPKSQPAAVENEKKPAKTPLRRV